MPRVYREKLRKTRLTPTKHKKKEVEDLVIKLANERKSSVAIGEILMKKHRIKDVKKITGKSISQIMKENNLYPELPEDLLNLLRKAVNLRDHLEKHKQDKHSRKGLENLESRIRRLGKYYVRKKILPTDWKYEPSKAKLIIQK